MIQITGESPALRKIASTAKKREVDKILGYSKYEVEDR
jgi:hypothetical protein